MEDSLEVIKFFIVIFGMVTFFGIVFGYQSLKWNIRDEIRDNRHSLEDKIRELREEILNNKYTFKGEIREKHRDLQKEIWKLRKEGG